MTINREREIPVNTGNESPAHLLAFELAKRYEEGLPLDKDIYLNLYKTFRAKSTDFFGPALPLVIAGENGYSGVVEKIAQPLIEDFEKKKAKSSNKREKGNWAVSIAVIKMEKIRADKILKLKTS